jgi:hypothetical protein
MNSNREGGQFNFELPPQPEPLEGGEKRQDKGQEAAPAPQERVGQQAPPPALPAIPDDIPAADTTVIAVPVKDDTAAARPVPDSSAQDSDRIEPAWVNKAKEIIARTHDDPYLQKDQMSKVKADYIMKRFNKQIKTEGAE